MKFNKLQDLIAKVPISKNVKICTFRQHKDFDVLIDFPSGDVIEPIVKQKNEGKDIFVKTVFYLFNLVKSFNNHISGDIAPSGTMAISYANSPIVCV